MNILNPLQWFKFFNNKRYRNKEMVSWWKTKTAVEAKLTLAKEGHYVMKMQGEKYDFPGHPRAILLFGSLAPLKHLIKNKVFNEAHKMLEEGFTNEAVNEQILKNLREVFEATETGKEKDEFSWEMKPMLYDMLPPERLVPAVKEIWRAMTVIEKGSPSTKKLKEVMCFILQEDDAYRMRLQWLVKFFNPNSLWRKIWRRDPIKDLEFALNMLEEAEVIGDMKGKQRLLRRITLVALKEPKIRQKFQELIQEVDWNKVKLSKADKYFFRAKYFKVDYPEYQY